MIRIEPSKTSRPKHARSLFFCTFFALATVHATAALVSAGEIPVNGGSLVFELYDDPASLAECRGKNTRGAIANLKKNNKVTGYGTGCWAADDNGFVHLQIKSFSDGVLRGSKVHNSKFASVSQNPEAPSTEIAVQMKHIATLNSQCRGGSGDSPKTLAACQERDKQFNLMQAKGWCWGTEGQAGYERTWVRCKH